MSDLAPFGHPVKAVAVICADLVAKTYEGAVPLAAVQNGPFPAHHCADIIHGFPIEYMIAAI